MLGTTFNVRAYPFDSMIRVSVASGQVQVAACKAEDMVLHPSEQANFHKNTRSIVREIFDPLDILGWKDGVLFFRKASFPEILDELERWYGVEILVKGIPKPRRFSGEFRQQSLENVLKGIGFSLGFDFTIAGDTVQIIHQ